MSWPRQNQQSSSAQLRFDQHPSSPQTCQDSSNELDLSWHPSMSYEPRLTACHDHMTQSCMGQMKADGYRSFAWCPSPLEWR